MAKVTKTNFKSFIKKNADKLHIRNKYAFSGMTDGMESGADIFTPAKATADHVSHTYGIDGVWLVGGGRDYFNEFDNGEMKGIEVYNACGCFIVAAPQQTAA